MLPRIFKFSLSTCAVSHADDTIPKMHIYLAEVLLDNIIGVPTWHPKFSNQLIINSFNFEVLYIYDERIPTNIFVYKKQVLLKHFKNFLNVFVGIHIEIHILKDSTYWTNTYLKFK